MSVTTSTKKQALVIPANSVVDLGGRRGVFTPLNASAVFRALSLGTEQSNLVEVLGGLNEGDTVITTGSSALRDGDRIVMPGGAGGRGRRGGGANAGDTAGSAPRGDTAGNGGAAREGTPPGAEAREGGSGRRFGGGGEGSGARPGGSLESGSREGGSRDGRGRRGAAAPATVSPAS